MTFVLLLMLSDGYSLVMFRQETTWLGLGKDHILDNHGRFYVLRRNYLTHMRRQLHTLTYLHKINYKHHSLLLVTNRTQTLVFGGKVHQLCRR